MAKKNSSKTATEKALQQSEPRLQVFTGWQGINIKEAPLGWEPLETGWADHRTTDLKPNFFLVQNNLETCDSLTVETRHDSKKLIDHHLSSNSRFTGVACLFHRWLFLAERFTRQDDSFYERIFYTDITDPDDPGSYLVLHDADLNIDDPTSYMIEELGYFEGMLIATTRHSKDVPAGYKIEHEGEVFTCNLNYEMYMDISGNVVQDRIDPGNPDRTDSTVIIPNMLSAKLVDNPVGEQLAPRLSGVGDIEWETPPAPNDPAYEDYDPSNWTTRIDVCYVYTNRFGTTMPSYVSTIYLNHDPVTYSDKRYLQIESQLPDAPIDVSEITGVDIFASVDNKQTKAFIGHVDLRVREEGNAFVDKDPENGQPWKYKWLGAMQDVSQWTNATLYLPEENTTKGAPCSHFAVHDSRIYWWGDPDYPYRLYIGGNPGSEMSIARGLGGAWIDIEPGTGIEINGTAKWKTAGGSNIVTMMCGNPNTNMVKRFNLVETNTTVTNEIASKGYMYEEVSNVVGCNSRWGYGVFADGLYSISRYGVTLTTMAMEYNNQMRTQQVSDVIQPVFTERLGNRLKDCRMVYIDGVIYIVFSEDSVEDEPTNLDQVIMCYDVDLKAWYTFTHDQRFDADGSDERIHHIMAIDSDEHTEGLGVITDSYVYLYPTTGIQEEVAPEFSVILETGELSARKPNQDHHYICQLELHFDYFIGNAEVIVEGVDYYGRPFKVNKTLNRRGYTELLRDWVEWIRIDKYVESYRIRLIGHARFRLVSINAKAYTVSKKVGIVYGYDDHNHYRNRQDGWNDDHHYIKDYNNLRRALVP